MFWCRSSCNNYGGFPSWVRKGCAACERCVTRIVPLSLVGFPKGHRQTSWYYFQEGREKNLQKPLPWCGWAAEQIDELLSFWCVLPSEEAHCQAYTLSIIRGLRDQAGDRASGLQNTSVLRNGFLQGSEVKLRWVTRSGHLDFELNPAIHCFWKEATKQPGILGLAWY